jgi:phage shock protein C
MEPRRLYRSQKNKMIAGVCGGYAEYFDVDPMIMRVLFLLLAFVGGSGFFIYLASLILLPKRPLTFSDQDAEPPVDSRVNVRYILGGILVFIGAMFLLSNLGVFSFMHAWDFSWEFVFPILLILLGMAIIYYRQNEQIPEGATQAAPGTEGAQQTPPFSQAPKQLRRSITDRKIFGVCGGLADYFSIDPNLTRILYIVLCLATGGAGVILYFVLALIVPDDRFVSTSPGPQV